MVIQNLLWSLTLPLTLGCFFFLFFFFISFVVWAQCTVQWGCARTIYTTLLLHFALLELRYYNYYCYYCVLLPLIVFIFPCIMDFCGRTVRTHARTYTHALTCSPLYHHVNDPKYALCIALFYHLRCFALDFVGTAGATIGVAIILFFILHSTRTYTNQIRTNVFNLCEFILSFVSSKRKCCFFY